MEDLEFNQIRLDAFREISSMAAGHAASSLSTMLGRRVDLTEAIAVGRLCVGALRPAPDESVASGANRRPRSACGGSGVCAADSDDDGRVRPLRRTNIRPAAGRRTAG